MRTKIATVLAAAIVGVMGVVLAGPVLAAVGADRAAVAVDGRVDKIKAALSGLVGDQTLTQEQADKVAETLADAKLGGPGKHGRLGKHGPFGKHGLGGKHGADLATAAAALGMTEAELRTALQSGKSLAAIAKEKGVSVATLVDKLTAPAKARLEQGVKDGKLTQAEANQKLAKLKTHLTDKINKVRPARPDGTRRGEAPDEKRPSPSVTPGSFLRTA